MSVTSVSHCFLRILFVLFLKYQIVLFLYLTPHLQLPANLFMVKNLFYQLFDYLIKLIESSLIIIFGAFIIKLLSKNEKTFIY